MADENQTANEIFFDAAIRHQVSVRRFSTGEVKAILKLLDKADTELADLLRRELGKLAGRPLDMKAKRLDTLLKDVKTARQELMKAIKQKVRPTLYDFAAVEEEAERRAILFSIPVQIELAAVATDTLRAAVTTRPFSGGKDAARTLDQWFESLARADQARIVGAIQLGLAQGETVDQMVKRIIGTKAERYTDGILQMTRLNAEAVVRTAVNHVSNAAREEVWTANADIVAALRWTSTLDGRTSAICRSRDGMMVPIGDNPLPKGAKQLAPPGARPPAHPNCRSVMVAVLTGEGIDSLAGERPFVRDTRTGDQRQIDFRQEARDRAGSSWADMSRTERNAAVKKVRADWYEQNVGRVPSATTYNDWLKKQPAAFQDQVLGKAKGALYRKGGLTLDQYVDRAGNELTLDQLRAEHPGAFAKAGL